MRILIPGELNPDLIFASLTSELRAGHEAFAREFALRLGSSSAICASGLAKLGHAVTFVGRAGADIFGRYSIEQLASAGVDVGPVLLDERLTTGLTVSISAGDRALLTFPGAIEALTAADVTNELLRRGDHLHVSSYFIQTKLQPGLPDLFRRARELGLTTSLDPGGDPFERWAKQILDMLPDCDVFLPNEVELEALTGRSDLRESLASLVNGRTLVIAKLGRDGCAACDREGRISFAPALPVDPVDTTGAGDSFNAGFLDAWLRGRSLAEALRSGVTCGGLSTRALGGCAAQPDAAELQAVLREAAGRDELFGR